MQHSRLLKLPAELRNTIYQLASGTSDSNIIFDKTQVTVPSAALNTACRQLRQEYLPIFTAAIDQAETIYARVNGFDFYALIPLLTHLPARPDGVRRHLKVTFVFGKSATIFGKPATNDVDGLWHWCMTCEEERTMLSYAREYAVDFDWGDSQYVKARRRDACINALAVIGRPINEDQYKINKAFQVWDTTRRYCK